MKPIQRQRHQRQQQQQQQQQLQQKQQLKPLTTATGNQFQRNVCSNPSLGSCGRMVRSLIHYLFA